MSIDQHCVSSFLKIGVEYLSAKREKRHACHRIRNTGITDKQAFVTLATLPQQPEIHSKDFLFVPLNQHIIAQVTGMYNKVSVHRLKQ